MNQRTTLRYSNAGMLRVMLGAGILLLVACGSGQTDANGSSNSGPEPEGPAGVDYRASCVIRSHGVCVDVFTAGAIDANQSLPYRCEKLDGESCIKNGAKGVCKLEQKQNGDRVYSEYYFYNRRGEGKVVDVCITQSGRLVRF